MIRVLMMPFLSDFGDEESGIRRVVEAYHKYAPKFGIEYVECKYDDVGEYDVFCVHAGTTSKYPKNKPIAAILHGLYWSADYSASMWEWKANRDVIGSIKLATEVTVPSRWVAKTIERDMRFSPHVVGHGIEWEEWQHDYDNDKYVLWNKNRSADVCNPYAIGVLAERFPDIDFITTFPPYGFKSDNLYRIGLKEHAIMKRIIQGAGVYLSTTKETFGIGVLEALASGVPVLGFAHGGNKDIIQHGINGYLAQTNDYDDLAAGLDYCVKHRNVLGKNAILTARQWSWEKPVEQLAHIYESAYEKYMDYQRPMTIDMEYV